MFVHYFAISYIPAYIYAEEKEGISENPKGRDTTKGEPESVPEYSERDEQLKYITLSSESSIFFRFPCIS